MILLDDQNGFSDSNEDFFEDLSKFVYQFSGFRAGLVEFVHKLLPTGKYLEASLETILRSLSVREKNTSKTFQVVASYNFESLSKRLNPDQRDRIRKYHEVIIFELRMLVGISLDYFTQLSKKDQNTLFVLNTSEVIRALIGESFHILFELKHRNKDVPKQYTRRTFFDEVSEETLQKWLISLVGLVKEETPDLLPIKIDPKKIGNLPNE